MSYSITIVSVKEFTSVFKQDIGKLSYTWHMPISDCEILYDWLIREAFKRILRDCLIQDHWRHDIYRCIYDDYGCFLEYVIKRLIKNHHLTFVKNEKLKLLIAGDDVLIARGSLN